MLINLKQSWYICSRLQSLTTYANEEFTYVPMCFVVPFVTAQETEEFKTKFDSIRFDAIVNVSAKDFDKAIKIADSLYNTSTTKKYKANALMLSSELYQRKGLRKQAIIYAQQAGEMISGEKFYVLEAQIYAFYQDNIEYLDWWKKVESI